MQQLKLAFRHLAKTPFVTAVAILSIGLGIGANTAVFSLFNQVLMRPLPVSAPAELVNLAAPGPKNGSQSCGNAGDCDTVFSYAMYQDLARDPKEFTGIAAHRIYSANVGYRNETLTVDGVLVSGNYFGLLGLQPAAGRLITSADADQPGNSPVVVLSYDYWVTRFARDPNIAGQTAVINGHTFSIIGVAPSGFDGTTRGTRVKVFVPITMRAQMEPPFAEFGARDDYWVYLFARLKPGVKMAAADAAINVPYHAFIANELPLQKGMKDSDKAAFAAKRVTLSDGRRGQSQVFGQAAEPLTVLQIVCGVVLLIACANVANLLLARAAARSGEMAVRLSIGASRGQLIRQLLFESCLLAALGGIAGLVCLKWTTDIMVSNLQFGAIDPAVSQIGWEVVMFAMALATFTGLLFGLFPAIQATRPNLAVALKGQSGQPSGSRAAARFRTTLVVAQIALSMGLLTCAGLFIKSLINVSRVELGVKIDHVVTFTLNPQRNGYTPARAQQFFADVIARLAAVPGVQSVAASRVPVISNSSSSTSMSIEGYTPQPGERTSIRFTEISPGYFKTIGMPFRAGRDFNDGDVFGAPKVAIINEMFAKQYKLGANPVGRRLRRGGSEKDPFDIEVVGMVADAVYNRVREPIAPVFFLPYRQNDRLGQISFYALTADDPEKLVAAVRPIIASMDSTLPIARLNTMTRHVALNVANDRVMSILSATFAGLATALAAIGLFGVLAYTVSQRTREFGLRMALGAAPSTVQRLVLRQVAFMTFFGAIIGIGLALGAGRWMSAQLFQMSSTDPTVIVASVVTLTLVAFGAGFLPSRRASRVDPMKALRWE